MTLFRVTHTNTDGCGGFSWHETRLAAEHEAEAYNRLAPGHRATVERVDFDGTKIGMLRMLSIYAAHPDNG